MAVCSLDVRAPQSPGPQATVRSFLSSWTHRDWAAMSRLVDHPPTDFAKVNVVALSDLGVTKASYVAGPVTQHGEMASARVTEHLRLAGVGQWIVHTTLHLKERSGHWLVEWSPETIDPALTSGAHFAVETTWAPRAPILGAGGAPLTTRSPDGDRRGRRQLREGPEIAHRSTRGRRRIG